MADTHTGRFKIDDTFRKWTMRIFAFIGFVTVVTIALAIAGLVAVFNGQ
jgi:hypothetical protein